METSHMQEGYLLSYNKACDSLKQRSPQEMAENSGAVYEKANSAIRLRYLDKEYLVAYPNGEVTFCTSSEKVELPVKIVIMHYLLRASGLPLTKQVVSFKDLPDGGMLYFEPFRNRVLRGLTAVFGSNSELMRQAAKSIGGRLENLGNVAVTIDILPKLPVTFVVWCGDEEFGANATALYDANVRYYLSVEDLVVATAAAASLLCRSAKAVLKQDSC